MLQAWKNDTAGGFEDASVRLNDIQKGSKAEDRTEDEDSPGSEVTQLCGHSGPIFGLDFSHDKTLLFSSSADSTVRLWHLELAACLNQYK